MRSTPRLPDPEVNLPKEHPLHEAALLIAAAAALVVVAFFVVAFFVDAVVLLVPPEAEARVLSVPAFEAAGDPADAAEQAQLAQLLSALEEGWPNPPYAFTVGIVDEAAPNAFALPGGRILVTRGLLDEVESENELAMVLAHELGHFKNRDHLRSLGRGLLLSLLLAGAGFGTDNPLLSTTSGLMTLSYGRKQESSADAFGLHLLAAHYGHVAGSADFFERMQKVEAAGVQERVPAFVRSHPRSGDRVAELRRLAANSGYARKGTLKPWPPLAP